jgi:ParB-like chromosome segregation protein Spo0J
MKIIKSSIESLSNDPNNARKHDSKNIAALKGSLRKFGQQKPIVVNKAGVVIAGNGTLEAARQLKWETIDTVVTELDDFNATAYALADNRTAELASWDEMMLGSTLQALREDGFDIGEIGFSLDFDGSDEDKEKKKDKDEVEPLPPEYLIVITAENETDQAQIFEELQGRNIKCKIMS